MAVGRCAVAGFAHRTQQLRAQQVTLRVVLQHGEQPDHFIAVRQVADLDVEGGEVLAQFGQAGLIRIVMDAVKRRQLVRSGEAGDGLVGEKHVLLN